MWIMTLSIAINKGLLDNAIVMLCDKLRRIVLTRVPTNHMVYVVMDLLDDTLLSRVTPTLVLHVNGLQRC